MCSNFVVVGKLQQYNEEKNIISILNNKNDLIDICINDFQNRNIKEYLVIGDIIGIKGEIKNGNKLVATKLTFLSSKEKEDLVEIKGE